MITPRVAPSRYNKWLIISVVILWSTIAILVMINYNQKKVLQRTTIILKEQFEKELGKTQVLKLFEPTSHTLVIDVLFAEWLKHRNTSLIEKLK